MKSILKKYLPKSYFNHIRKTQNGILKFYDEFNNHIYLDRVIGFIENQQHVKVSNRRFDYVLLEGTIINISFLIGTSQAGLLLYNNGKIFQLSADDGFYGITKYNDEWYAFHKTGGHGRVISFNVRGNCIYNVQTKIWGLSRGVHQIDFIKDKLYLTDTYNNAILKYDDISNFKRPLYWRKYSACYHPNGKLNRGRTSKNYNHFNSIYAYDKNVYLIAHNETFKTKRLSEIYILDESFLKNKIRKINGSNCHNYYKDKNSEVICLSMEGKIQHNGRSVLDLKQFTRGASISDDYFIFGGSDIELNATKRTGADGVVFITTKEFELISKLMIKNTQIQEIRRLDKQEYTLSNVEK